MEIKQGGLPSASDFKSSWDRMLGAWRSPDTADRAWVLFSANYLIVTAGVRWAMDPITYTRRLPSMPQADLSPLSALDAIVLTHAHADHLDPSLLHNLRDLPIKWIIPEVMLPKLQSLRLPAENVVIPQPQHPIHLGGLSLTPFDGLHLVPDQSLPGGIRGVPSLGYLAEFNHKKWMFPSDTRVFDATRLPRFGALDGLMMHVWLGKGQALNSHLPLLDPFCRFGADLQPKRIILTHLYEWGRPPEELWTESHALLIEKWFAENSPGLPVQHALMGDKVDL